MKHAVLQPVCTPAVPMPNGWQPDRGPMLIGWVRQPVARFQVDGRAPREQLSATLMIVHME